MASANAYYNIHFLRSRRDAFKKICEYYLKEIKDDTPISILEFFERQIQRQFEGYKEILDRLNDISSEPQDREAEVLINNLHKIVLAKIAEQKEKMALEQ